MSNHLNQEREKDLSPNTATGLTMKDMCEHIVKAEFIEDPKTHVLLTPRQIFNYSSTGDLYMIIHWYELACEILGFPAEHNLQQ